MNSVRSNNLSLKYQRFTTLGSKDIRIINSEFVARSQFLCIYHFCNIRFILNNHRNLVLKEFLSDLFSCSYRVKLFSSFFHSLFHYSVSILLIVFIPFSALKKP